MRTPHERELKKAADHPEDIQDWSPEEISYMREQAAKLKARAIFAAEMGDEEFEALWARSAKYVDEHYVFQGVILGIDS